MIQFSITNLDRDYASGCAGRSYDEFISVIRLRSDGLYSYRGSCGIPEFVTPVLVIDSCEQIWTESAGVMDLRLSCRFWQPL